MHELSVTESLLNLAIDHANRAGASRVTDLNLVIGRLSSIIDDSIQFYWDIISQDTICAGATLHFQRIPAEFLCLDCENKYILENELEPCPRCGSNKIVVTKGEEFFLDSIEVENKL